MPTSIELSGYIIGSVVGLLLTLGLILLIMRRYPGREEATLLQRYIQHVVGPPQHVRRFLFYGVAAILIAGVVLSLLGPSAPVREVAQSIFPWLVVVYISLALIGFVRWVRHH